MVNDVRQQLHIYGEDALQVIKHVMGTASAFDFNAVIPMPEELNIESSSDGRMGLAAITGECDEYVTREWLKELEVETAEQFRAYVTIHRPHAIELGKKYLHNQHLYGHTTWYDWCIENWGTKWNAYEVRATFVSSDHAALTFYTSWGPPFPVIVKLSETFPRTAFVLDYTDGSANVRGTLAFLADKRGREARDRAIAELEASKEPVADAS